MNHLFQLRLSIPSPFVFQTLEQTRVAAVRFLLFSVFLFGFVMKLLVLPLGLFLLFRLLCLGLVVSFALSLASGEGRESHGAENER